MKARIALLLFVIRVAYADMITLHNETEYDIYVGTYYYSKTAERVGDIKLICAKTAETIQRPESKFLYDRQVLFSLNDTDLAPVVSDDQFSLLGTVNIGELRGSDFYLGLYQGRIEGYNALSWEVAQPIINEAEKVYQALDKATMGQLQRKYGEHAYARQKAYVRVNSGVPKEEQAYLKVRHPLVKHALESMLSMKLEDDEVPRIAFCSSGGGYRAMIATVGLLIGAHSSGLLDSTTYIAGLSGSTWAIAPWVYQGLSPEEFKQQLIPRVTGYLFQAPLCIKQLNDSLLKKFAFNQPLSLVDVYGGFLAAHLLGQKDQDPYTIELSQQIERISTGKWVFPIYTAVMTELPYEWIEFTPYEIGCNYLGGYVPAWSFGRKFLKGTSQDNAPAQSLGYLMGIWGSAFTADLEEIFVNFEDEIKPKELRELLKLSTTETIVGQQRISPAVVRNFTYGMLMLPRGQLETLTLVDAGLSFNIPLPPLLRKERAIDIIIILDSSADLANGAELQKAELYCKEHNIPLPPINYTGIDKNICTIFMGSSSVPTLMYMPLVKNPRYGAFDPAKDCMPSYCNTFNFAYTPAQVQELSGLVEFNIKESKDVIIKVIRQVIEAKRAITVKE